MKTIIILIFVNAIAITNSRAQTINILTQVWNNTFGNQYLNNWLLVNQSFFNDSTAIVEGSLNDYKYTEIESQCKYLYTKNTIVVVDDEDKVIYKLPKSFEKIVSKGIDISTMEVDTTEITTDSGNIGAKYILNTTYLGNDVQIQIDTNKMLIDWIKATEEDIQFDEETQTQKNNKVVQTFLLVSHVIGKEEIGKYLDIDNYIKKTQDGYLGQGIYKSYEIINMLD